MIKFISYVLKTLLLTAIIILGLFVSLVSIPTGVFSDTYQSVIQRKYDKLMTTDNPKIIVIGGSNTSFSLVDSLLEARTGYEVANLGLHAGFGAIVPTELAKQNINEGDIVLLAYEWDWYLEDYFTLKGTDLVMSGFDHRLDMYTKLPINEYSKLFGYLFEFVDKKQHHTISTGVYSSSAFDEDGEMIMDRPVSITTYKTPEECTWNVYVKDAVIAEDVVEELIDLKAFIEKKGASVYFVAPPFYEGASRCNAEDYRLMAQQTTEKTGIPYISDPNDYLFPLELIYDTIYHCTTEGSLLRTELLAKDLENAGILTCNYNVIPLSVADFELVHQYFEYSDLYVCMKNTGQESWTYTNQIRCYLTENGQQIGTKSFVYPNQEVAPGETVTFRFVNAKESLGNNAIITMEQENIQKFNRTVPVTTDRDLVSIKDTNYEVLEQTINNKDLIVTIKNTSTEIWKYKDWIRCCLFQNDGDTGIRSYLPAGHEVLPGETVTFCFENVLPTLTETSEIVMLQETIQYFPLRFSVNIN